MDREDSLTSPQIVPDSGPHVDETISASPYTAQLIGYSGEAAATRDFFRLVDAIRWLAGAVDKGALVKQATIYSARGELVWAKSIAVKELPREDVMKRNAQRILLQTILG